VILSQKHVIQVADSAQVVALPTSVSTVPMALSSMDLHQQVVTVMTCGAHTQMFIVMLKHVIAMTTATIGIENPKNAHSAMKVAIGAEMVTSSPVRHVKMDGTAKMTLIYVYHTVQLSSTLD
jgi:hypothetical protein